MDGRNFLSEDPSREWTSHHMSELIIGMGDFTGLVGRNMMDSRWLMEDLALTKEIKREGCC